MTHIHIDEGERKVAVGETITFEMTENAGGGYQTRAILPQGVTQLNTRQGAPNLPGTIGGPVRRYFDLVATTEGEHFITFVEERPWEVHSYTNTRRFKLTASAK